MCLLALAVLWARRASMRAAWPTATPRHTAMRSRALKTTRRWNLPNPPPQPPPPLFAAVSALVRVPVLEHGFPDCARASVRALSSAPRFRTCMRVRVWLYVRSCARASVLHTYEHRYLKPWTLAHARAPTRTHVSPPSVSFGFELAEHISEPALPSLPV